MSTALNTRVLTQAAELRDIAVDWSDLCNRCRVTPFQRPEWILSWVDAFSPQNIRVVEVRSGGTLVGLAPLLIYPRGQERLLAFMGGGISDYLDLLVDRLSEHEIVIAIVDALRELDDWTTLYLTDLPASSVLNRTNLERLATPHDNCPALLLPKTREELLQHLSKRQRANLRNARSRIQREGGGVIELATAATVPEFLDDLFRLHASRWSLSGQSGVLADENVKAFHRQSAAGLFAHGLLRLYRLRVRHHVVAVVYTLFERTTVFCYMQGYDPDFGHLSPGTHLMFSVMEDAIQSGISKFDLLRGQEAYKQHWRAEIEATHRIQLVRLETVRTAPSELVAA